ncbi:hypothetical protein GCM10025868_12340 [Angustibacter aerolatus]|uniref:NAD-specific glutamate dehydrogenase C-terminal domain-containing protein n=1 Tax=Angustibacter aerolatus TaxID=1162965 RepID=A0ABQ6JFQ8_9ACTN|nr:hypothetical protein GCM10025868_12340 [Angustibacter aerolatus]
MNRGGITFEFRLHEETQATPAQTARAYVVAREVFGMRDFVEQVEALDNQVPTSAQSAVYLEFRRLVDRAVRWLVQSRPAIVDIAAEIERYRPVVQRLRDGLGDLVTGAERDALQARVASLVEPGRARRPGPAHRRACSRCSCCSTSPRSPSRRRRRPRRSRRCTSW